MPPSGAARRGGRGRGPIGGGDRPLQWRRLEPAAPVGEPEPTATLGEEEPAAADELREGEGAGGREAEAEKARRPPEQPPPPRPPAHWPDAEGSPGGQEEHAPENGAKVEEDRGNRVRLAQQLKVAETQAAQRSAHVARLREDVRRLESEAGIALQTECRLLSESKSLKLHSSSSEEAFRGQQSELMQKIRESEQRGAESRCKEREWREELDSMARQQGSLADEVADLERTVGRWRKAAHEQAERVSCAERRLKNLEAQRSDLRSQGMQLQQLAGRHKETAVRERATVQELKGRIEAVEAGSGWQAMVLQATVLALWVLVLWLLVAD